MTTAPIHKETIALITLAMTTLRTCQDHHWRIATPICELNYNPHQRQLVFFVSIEPSDAG